MEGGTQHFTLVTLAPTSLLIETLQLPSRNTKLCSSENPALRRRALHSGPSQHWPVGVVVILGDVSNWTQLVVSELSQQNS